MRNILRPSWLILIISFTAFLSYAAAEDADTLTLDFRQGKSAIDPHLAGNDTVLNRLREIGKSLQNPDTLASIRHISVIGGASPEGSISINRTLSQRRAQEIFDFISQGRELPDLITTFTFLGRDWAGLRMLVEKDPDVPYREETLTTIDEILENHPNVVDNDNLQRLKSLRGSEPYRYMYSHLFPILRASTLILDFYPSIPVIRIPEFAGSIVTVPEIEDITFLPDEVLKCNVCKKCKPFYMDLRTNMLLDAMILPNIGAEFYLGKNWSIVGNWMYGWWDKDNIHRYWRAYGGDLGVRYWIGKKAHEKPLTGHHLGVYTGVITYDFEFGGRGYMGGRPSHSLWDRCNWYAGIEYGYSLPIARRLNIDFTLGIGYLTGKLLEYVPKDGHYLWQKTKRLQWVGPTKAEISLVWLIGCDNYNRKGGRK